MISYLNGVSIGEIIVYLPALAVAGLLCWRHGFGRSSGWFFLIIFCLIRIIGACFNLATISDPTNLSLYIGYSILSNIGLSPLELTGLGLLSRIISSINKNKATFLQPHHIKLIQTVVTVGLILGIVGGIDSSNDYAKNNNQIVPSTLTKAGLGLFIGSYVLITLTTIILSFTVSHAEPGEKRLLLAVGLSLPFLLVRLIYSAIAVFGNNASFNSNTTIVLCMALLMELAAFIIYEAVGITLQKVASAPPVGERYERAGEGYEMENETALPKGPSVGQQVADTLGRRTIIGRLITGQPGQSRRERRRERRAGY
jgi:hypothetical protein